MCKLRLNLSGIGANKEVRTEKGMRDARAKLDYTLFPQAINSMGQAMSIPETSWWLPPTEPYPAPCDPGEAGPAEDEEAESVQPGVGSSWLPPCRNLCVELGAQES